MQMCVCTRVCCVFSYPQVVPVPSTPSRKQVPGARGGLGLARAGVSFTVRPVLTQWVVYAIRNLTEDNSQNQDAIAKMEEQGLADASVLKKMGFQVEKRGDKLILKSTSDPSPQVSPELRALAGPAPGARTLREHPVGAASSRPGRRGCMGLHMSFFTQPLCCHFLKRVKLQTHPRGEK
ncbi:Ataxin-10 [Galemys pyrenaicus]|uniref:Ataxin-10 n=1 Tax=Galemys pyrenaicus TaxID=202257 RepID=A0A8J6DQB2_GALPY|nr:Ataxin-10 [Galemys pyrenaicus]